MKEIHIKIILKWIKILAPNKRKPKFSAEYYLENILNLLKDFTTWESLKKSSYIDKTKRYHYKTIADIHRLWCKKNVYRKAFEEIRNRKIDLGNLTEIDLLIDSTLIINKNGSDYIGYGSETTKKKFSKITMLTDINDNVINVVENNISEKEILLGQKKVKRKRGRPKKNDANVINTENSKCIVSTYVDPSNNRRVKKIIINTLEHDIKGIVPVLEGSGIPKNVKINIIGDKGYIVNDNMKKILSKRNTCIITPYRNNQKKKNTEDENKKLKKRSGIERKFSSIKSCSRIHVRKDKKMVNYMGFFYLGIINTF